MLRPARELRRERREDRELPPPTPEALERLPAEAGGGVSTAGAGLGAGAGGDDGDLQAGAATTAQKSGLDRKILVELRALQSLPLMAWRGARGGRPGAPVGNRPGGGRGGGVGLSAVLGGGAGGFDGHRGLAVEKGIATLDEVRAGFRVARKLFLSHNDLTSLNGIEQFPELRVLSVQSNRIASLSEVRVLTDGCPHLEVASFEGNPLESTPNYREQLLGILPALKMLDGAPVTERERAEARVTVSQEAHLMDMALENLGMMHQLERLTMLRRVHLDMFRRQEIGQPLFWRDSPSVAVPDTRMFLAQWDFFRSLPEAEVQLMRTEINAEVVRRYNASRLRSGKRISWGHAVNDVVMAQQNAIARLMALVDLLGAETRELAAAAEQRHNPLVTAEKLSIQARLGSVSTSAGAGPAASAESALPAKGIAQLGGAAGPRSLQEANTDSDGCRADEQLEATLAGYLPEEGGLEAGAGEDRGAEWRSSGTTPPPSRTSSSGAPGKGAKSDAMRSRKLMVKKGSFRPMAAKRELPTPRTPGQAEQSRRVRELEAEVAFQREGAAVLESRNARLEEQLVYYHNQSADALKSTEAELLGLQDEFQGALNLQDDLEARVASAVAERDAALCDLSTEREEVARLSDAVALVESLHSALAEKEAQVEWLTAEQERVLEEATEQKKQTLEYREVAEHCREMLQATLTNEERSDRVGALASRCLQRRFLLLLQCGAEACKQDRAHLARALEFQRWAVLRRWLSKLWKASLLSKRIRSLEQRRALSTVRTAWGSWKAGLAQHLACMERMAEVWTTLARMRAQHVLSCWLVAAGRERIECEGVVCYHQMRRAVQAWRDGVAAQRQGREKKVLALRHRSGTLQRRAACGWRAWVAHGRKTCALNARAQVFINASRRRRLGGVLTAWALAVAASLRAELHATREKVQAAEKKLEETCEAYKERSSAVDLENLQLMDRVHELSRNLASAQAAARDCNDKIEALRADSECRAKSESALQSEISRLQEEQLKTEAAHEMRATKLREALDQEVEKGAQAALKMTLMVQEHKAGLAAAEQQLAEKEATVSALRKASTAIQGEVSRMGSEWQQRVTAAKAEAYELKRLLEEKDLAVIKMQTIEANNHLVSEEERNRLLQNLAHLQEALSLSEDRNQELKTQVLCTQQSAYESQSVAREALGEGGNLLAPSCWAPGTQAPEKSLAPSVAPGAENFGMWRSTPEALTRAAGPGSALSPSAPGGAGGGDATPMSPQIASLHSEIQLLRSHILRKIGPE